jgi:hypothetical protein
MASVDFRELGWGDRGDMRRLWLARPVAQSGMRSLTGVRGVWGEGGVSLGLCETGRRDTRTGSAVRCTCEQGGAAVFDTGGTQRGGDTYRGQAG